MKNFKYIRSSYKDILNKTIYSGQYVTIYKNIKIREVYFDSDFGFRIDEYNFCDVDNIRILRNINILQKIYGIIRYNLFMIFGI